MIDMENEKLITLDTVSEMIPPRRKGRKVHKITIQRWIKYGHQGVFLGGVKQPGGWLTSREAVQRFLCELARKEHAQPQHVVEAQKRIEMSRGHEQAMKRLRARGLVD